MGMLIRSTLYVISSLPPNPAPHAQQMLGAFAAKAA